MTHPTGTVAPGPHGDEVRFTRSFHAAIEDVWAAITESDRLERWIGRWERDESGRTLFYMTAEGDNPEPEEYVIVECTAPRRLILETHVGDKTWHLDLALEHHGGSTTLTFAQAMSDDDMSMVGPGWEYYLDRLAAAVADEDVSAVAWDDYFPAMQQFYADLAAGARPPR